MSVMSISRERLAITGAAAALTVAALAGCGSAASPGGGSSSLRPVSASPAGTAHAANHNGTDVAFTQSMVQVESQSAATASLAAGHTTRPQVRQFAAHTLDQARRHDRQLRGWLASWHQAAPPPWSPRATTWYPLGPGMMGGYWHSYWTGMGSGWDEMQRLHAGPFDTGWTAMMARSYATQIALAQRELRSGVNPPARSFARWMLAHRPADLAQMQRWYHTRGGQNWNSRDWWNGWRGWHGMGWQQNWNGRNQNGQHPWNRNRSGWRNGPNGGCCW